MSRSSRACSPTARLRARCSPSRAAGWRPTCASGAWNSPSCRRPSPARSAACSCARSRRSREPPAPAASTNTGKRTSATGSWTRPPSRGEPGVRRGPRRAAEQAPWRARGRRPALPLRATYGLSPVAVLGRLSAALPFPSSRAGSQARSLFLGGPRRQGSAQGLEAVEVVDRAVLVDVGEERADSLGARREAWPAQAGVEPHQPAAGAVETVGLGRQARLGVAGETVGDQQPPRAVAEDAPRPGAVEFAQAGAQAGGSAPVHDPPAAQRQRFVG